MNTRGERACGKRFGLNSRLLVLLTLSLLPIITAPALPLAKPISRYVHTVWRTDEGLPKNYVVGIVQTRAGDLWFGTEGDGLVRYRHGEFLNYSRADGLSATVKLKLRAPGGMAQWRDYTGYVVIVKKS